MSRIAVVGATGFLGTNLVRAFAEAGDEVHAITRASSDTSAISDLASVHVHDGTAANMTDLMALIEPDAVVMLAALYVRHHSRDDISELVSTNVGLTTMAADAAAAAGARAFIHAGSAFQHYESSGYRPLNLYAASKEAAEAMLAYYQDAGLLTVVRLRLTDSYGPGDPRGKLVGAIANAQRSGEPLRLPNVPTRIDLMHISDVAAAVVAATHLGISDPTTASAQPYAVTSGRPRLISEVVEAWEEATGSAVPVIEGGYAVPERHIAEPWAGPPVPGWEPAVDLVDGFRALAAE